MRFHAFSRKRLGYLVAHETAGSNDTCRQRMLMVRCLASPEDNAVRAVNRRLEPGFSDNGWYGTVGQRLVAH